MLNLLKQNPFQGIYLGKDIRKIRMAITSKGGGKSKGARVITYMLQKNQMNDSVDIMLLYIYDKSEMPNVSDKFIAYLLQN